MKKIFLLFFLATITTITHAQKNDYLVSYDGIGALKLGLSKAELEKLLKINITLRHIGVDEVYVETIKAKYLGADVSLHLFRSEEKVAILEGVSTSSPLCKTADGIGTGTDQSTIINKFENDLLIIHPDYEEDKPNSNQITITLAGINDYRSGITFTLVNKKVISIKVAPTPEFRDRE